MRGFIKEVFSLENLKKCMAFIVFSEPNLNESDYVYLRSIMGINKTVKNKEKIIDLHRFKNRI